MEFIREQSLRMDSPFYIVDYSKKWQPPEKEWRDKLKKTISLVELIFIMTGKKTFKSHNVLDELDIAYNLGKPIMQFCDPGAKFAECKPVSKAGKLYRWEWDNLKTVMQNFMYVPLH